MVDSMEVLIERMNGDMKLIRQDLKNFIETHDKLAQLREPEKDRQKMIDVAMRAAIVGLAILEGLNQSGIGSGDVPSTMNGAYVVITSIASMV